MNGRVPSQMPTESRDGWEPAADGDGNMAREPWGPAQASPDGCARYRATRSCDASKAARWAANQGGTASDLAPAKGRGLFVLLGGGLHPPSEPPPLLADAWCCGAWRRVNRRRASGRAVGWAGGLEAGYGAGTVSLPQSRPLCADVRRPRFGSGTRRPVWESNGYLERSGVPGGRAGGTPCPMHTMIGRKER